MSNYRETPSPAGMLKTRLTLFLAIFVTLLQAIFCVIFLHSVPGGFSAPLVLLVMLWGICSTLAGIWLINQIQEGARPKNLEFDAAGDSQILAPEDQKNFSLAYLGKVMREGTVLLRGDRIVYANQSFAYSLGVAEADLIGASINAYLHKDDAALLETDSAKTVSRTVPGRAVVRLVTSLGDEYWAVCGVHPVSWRKEELRLLLFENITMFKQITRAMEEREMQQRALIECAPLGIAMFDPIGQIVVANTLWHSMWSNVVGSKTNTFNILHDPLLPRPDLERSIREAFNKRSSSVSHLELSAPWGETRWLTLNFHPILNPMGALANVFMIQQDNTDHVRCMRRENELAEQLARIRVPFTDRKRTL